MSDPRVDELIARMTLAEKVGQLVQLHAPRVADLEDRLRQGRVGSIFGIVDPGAINGYQRLARQESRLGIPLIVGNDVIHGYRTVFPIPLGEACTWDMELIEATARTAAGEAFANGTDWIFAPMVDISREPRWGRIAEGGGEDPCLGSLIAAARVRGFQASGHIAACPKHYVAYGAVESGRDYNTVDLSERALRDVYLPPFKAAFDAGANTVMSSFNDIAGVPATVNHFTLRTVLRHEWGWEGVVVSDYTAINELIDHGVAADLKDAARQSILAGVDMDMMSEAYDRHLAQLVEEGDVRSEAVDEAVRRVLTLKLRLGLFERERIDVTAAEAAVLTEDARALALRAAQESLVLLKNDAGVLPLPPSQRALVVGELANSQPDMLGCWSFTGRAEDAETVLHALRARLTSVEYVPSDVAAAVQAAERSDVVIAVVGETAAMSGEAHCRAHLGLPDNQQVLLDALANTGKPLVVILATGRPLAIPHVVDQAVALLLMWHPGIRAGRAVADVLLGDVTPSGKLAVTFPRAEGQIPIYYAHPNTGRPAEGEGTLQFDTPFRSTYLDEPNAPLFPFGFGLSFTSFAYADLTVAPPTADHVLASARVTNTGSRAGAEVVQLYVQDRVASVARPVRELKAFQRVRLEPGEACTVRFEVPVASLGFSGLDMQYRVEPGEFRLWIGADSASGLEGSFRI
jgi:beta-glucosidase